MTNREWLETLSSEQYSEEVISVLSFMEKQNCANKFFFDIRILIKCDFDRWLNMEHREDDV